MTNKLFFLTSFISGIILLSGCTFEEKIARARAFEFDSGGVYHPQGHGGWKIELDAEGKFSITHNVQSKVKEYGTFLLTEEENLDMWELIDTLDIGDMRSSERARIPDEIEYAFTLKDEEQIYSRKILINDAPKNDNITTLIDYIIILIEEYTGERPFLR